RAIQVCPTSWSPSTRKGSSCVPETMAAISPSPTLPRVGAADLGLTSGRRDMPDVPRIFADRPVRREPPHMGRVAYCLGGPGRAVAPERVNAALGGRIGGKVRSHHEPIVGIQPIDERTKTVRVSRREDTAGDGLQNLLQFRRGFDKRAGIESRPPT